MEHPAEMKRRDILESADTGQALISSQAAGYRESFPKVLINAVTRNGLNPPALRVMVTSNPIPQDYVFHVTRAQSIVSMGDGAFGIPLTMEGRFFIIADEMPFYYGTTQIQNPTTNAVNISFYDKNYSIIYPIDYYLTYGSVLSTFVYLDYNRGAAGPPATTMTYSVKVFGNLIKKPTDMRRGTAQPPIGAGIWARLTNAYRL